MMSTQIYTDEQKRQFFEILDTYPNAVDKMRAALVEGCIDGTGYGYGGVCGCLFSVVGRVYESDPMTLIDFDPVAAFGYISAIEELVYGIHEGDTPENNPVSALLVQWIDERQPVVDTKGGE